MIQMKLDRVEAEFIEVNRSFAFLFGCGYSGHSFAIGGRNPGVTFTNPGAKLRVEVDFTYVRPYLHVRIIRRRLMVSPIKLKDCITLDKIYERFGYDPQSMELTDTNISEVVRKNAELMREHLLPVLRGETWPKELTDLNQNPKPSGG